MIATKSPGIILKEIKHGLISVSALLRRKSYFRICKHENFYRSGGNADLNTFHFILLRYLRSR